MRQKPLLPSLKEKKRYVAFEVKSDRSLKFDDIKTEVVKGVNNFVGKLGFEKMGLMFLSDWVNNKGIVKVNNKYVDHLKSSFVLMENKNFMIRSLIVSGTLKKLRGVM